MQSTKTDKKMKLLKSEPLGKEASENQIQSSIQKSKETADLILMGSKVPIVPFNMSKMKSLPKAHPDFKRDGPKPFSLVDDD